MMHIQDRVRLGAERCTTAKAVPKPSVAGARPALTAGRRPAPLHRKPALSVSAIASPERISPLQESTTPVFSTPSTAKTGRPRIIVLGSGWSSMSFIKSLPANVSNTYEVILVSPRNYFLYTPLLPAVATGTMEERSIVEPVRNLITGKGEYYEAMCKEIDPVKKELVCCFPADAGFAEACFKIAYDVLIIGVGSVNNTFGIKGVDQYCNYFKSIEDANRLRCRVSECFERASLPGTSDDERKKLLSFVVVGGGPTGVEVAAEMHDMINDDLVRLYPNLIKDVRIRVVELMDHVLSTYDRAISIFTSDQFKRAGIELVLNSRVASVDHEVVSIVNKQNEVQEIKFGACVWATGIAMNPLIRAMQPLLPGQNHFRSILTDEYMRVKGSDGSIYAFGDSSTIYQAKAMEHAEELFNQADMDKDENLTIEELRYILNKASTQFTHLQEHATFLDTRAGGASRFGNLVKKSLASDSPLMQINETTPVGKEKFKELLGKIDSGLRALPATAQVAAQQGSYLANMFMSNKITGVSETTVIQPKQRPFEYSHKGSAAYVGRDNAVFDVPIIGPLYGWYAGFLWKSFETYSQISFRNRCLVFTDWLRCKVFGRDISRV